MELLTKLGINWQLLIAQMVNFAIVVGALSYFVYKPILNLIDERRERIRKSVEDSKRIDNQVKEMEEWKVEQMKKIDKETGIMLERSKQLSEQTKAEILAAAQKEADGLMLKARQLMRQEREQVLHDVQEHVTAMVMDLAQKILQREFSPADQKRLVGQLAKDIPSVIQ